MTPFKHVLVPSDFGEVADRALDLAIEIAAQFGAKITLFHTWVLPSVYAGYGHGLYWPIDDFEGQARTTLARTLAKAKERYPNIEMSLASGLPSKAILDIAKDRDVDLIVMGTHGRQGLSHAVLGSVAEKVVRLSPVPVLTVCADAEKAARALAGTTDATTR